MRQALSKLPLLAIKTLPASAPAYGPALKVYGRIRSAGSVGEPIVFLGDSLTSGAGLPFETAYPALVSEALGNRRYVNLGVGGETSGEIRRRFLRMAGYHGRPIVVWAGRNNYADGEAVIEDIAAILAAAADPRFLVLAVPAGAYRGEQPGEAGWAQIKALNAALAARFGSRFIDPNGKIGGGQRLDQIHLNRVGHRLVADTVTDAISRAGW